MARTVKPLNDTQLKNAKAKDKAYTISDGQGLQILIKSNNSKLWEFYYKSPTTLKRRKTSFGTYPTVTLKMAREKRDNYLKLIKDDIDPIDNKNEEEAKKKAKQEKEKFTIMYLVEQYFDFRKDELSPSTIKKDTSRIKFSFIDRLSKKSNTKLDDIDFNTIKTTLQYLEDDNKLETLKKVKGIIIRLLKFAFKRDMLDTTAIIGKLEMYDFKKKSKKNIKHNSTLTNEKDIKKLYNDILNYTNNQITKYLMIFTIHTAQRQGSIITAKWEDINFKKKLWIIPKENMKVKKVDHYLPLSDILIKYLKELYNITGGNIYLFPNSQLKSTRNKYPHISNNTVTKALRVMNYIKEQQTAHGFRAMFKTVCKEHQEEHNLNNEFVEKVLAHKIEGDVEASYNRATNVEDMRKVIEWWSSYIEGLVIND